MEKEIWKPVIGYEGFYEVSNCGRVKSLHRGKERILKPSPDGDGYLYVILCKNGEKSKGRVHQLVMRAFVGKCPDGYEVDHFDWNPKNNSLGNLSYQPKGVNRARRSPEWQQKNAEKNRRLAQDPEWLAKMQKLYQDPEWRRKCSKPVDQYTIDGQFVKRWSSAAEIEKELGIYNSSISKCCKGKYKSTGGFIWKFAV